MNHHATELLGAGYYQIGGLELRGDHRTLRQLLMRFECAEDRYERRDLLQLVVDLFEVHSAIESQARPLSARRSVTCWRKWSRPTPPARSASPAAWN